MLAHHSATSLSSYWPVHTTHSLPRVPCRDRLTDIYIYFFQEQLISSYIYVCLIFFHSVTAHALLDVNSRLQRPFSLNHLLLSSKNKQGQHLLLGSLSLHYMYFCYLFFSLNVYTELKFTFSVKSFCTNYSGKRTLCGGEELPGWNLLHSRDYETWLHGKQQQHETSCTSSLRSGHSSTFSWIFE